MQDTRKSLYASQATNIERGKPVKLYKKSSKDSKDLNSTSFDNSRSNYDIHQSVIQNLQVSKENKQVSIKQIQIQHKKTHFQTQKSHNITHNEGSQMCFIHYKPADLVCLQDNCIICSNCALFGKHKGHQVINRQGILNNFANYIEKCLLIYDDIKQIKTNFNAELCYQNWEKILQQSKQRNKNKIIQKFENLAKVIKILQKKQLMKLNQLYKQKDESYKQKIIPKVTQIEKKTQKWCQQIQKLGELMSETQNLQVISKCIPYIDENKNTGPALIQQGETLVDDMDDWHYKIDQLLGQQQNREQVNFDDETIKSLESYCNVKKQNHIQNKQLFSKSIKKAMFSLSPLKQNLQNVQQKQVSNFRMMTIEDNLLISVEPKLPINFNSNIQSIPSVEGVHFISQQLNPNKLQYLTISNIRPITHSNSRDESSDHCRSQDRQRQFKDIANYESNNPNQSTNQNIQKKKKKIEFPQKYKGIVDDLKNDRAQTIDLTGAQVGDGSILSLCPFIKKSKKLKILKLIKNKLTDDCLEQLINSISQTKVTTLNLSQNCFSDKSCAILMQTNITNLKTITLSLNKINRRNVKSKIDALAKKNIAILL